MAYLCPNMPWADFIMPRILSLLSVNAANDGHGCRRCKGPHSYEGGKYDVAAVLDI